jgi:MFS transporter, DHA1 family, inner membrane transport protein
MPPILYLFALTNLVIGTGAFALTGIIKPMSDDLGVSVAAAGQAMTAYAIASAFLPPLAIVLMGRWRGNLKP